MIHWLGDDSCHDLAAVGGKAANLSRLAALHRVPRGFAISSRGTAQVVEGRMPPDLGRSLASAYELLSEGTSAPVAVRSSAIDEDGEAASFAGQHETFLNIRGADALMAAVIRCVQSARTAEVIAYRQQHGLSVDDLAIAVLVQALVLSDVSAVVFSVNPLTGNRDQVVINASWGLGESVVGGTVTPDTYVVNKADLQLVSRTVAQKLRMTVLIEGGTREVTAPRMMQNMPTLQEEQAIEMARLAVLLEEHMGWPVDVECAVAESQLYLLQCRPITTLRH